MIRKLIFFAVVTLQLSLIAEPVILDVNVESSPDINQPLSGILTVTHPTNLKIDEDSFTLGSDSLSVQLIKSVSIGKKESGTEISLYRFELPQKKPGIYTLKKIYVEIGGKIYHTEEIKYEVVQPEFETKKPNETLFILEAAVEKPPHFYPGQRAKVIYRIYFNNNIELSSSNFPLLEAEGFIKVGDKQIQDAQQDGLNAQEISQEIEAVKPGIFSFPESFIEGYAYTEDSPGKKIYLAGKLRSESPPQVIEVLPFPKQQQPLSFSDVVGDLRMTLKLLNAPTIEIDKSMQLELYMKSEGNIDDLKLPNLYCQPGFSGFFSIDSIELMSVKKDSRLFQITLRPQTSLIKEVPPVEITSFDSHTAEYSVWQSTPLHIAVKEPDINIQKMKEFQPISEKALQALQQEFQKRPVGPLKLDSQQNITFHDLRCSYLARSTVLYFIPFALFLYYLQWILYKKWRR